MKRLWTEPARSNVLAEGLEDEWLKLAKLFTTALNDQDHKTYVYNGQMGLGKSQAAQVACGVLAAQYYKPLLHKKAKVMGQF